MYIFKKSPKFFHQYFKTTNITVQFATERAGFQSKQLKFNTHGYYISQVRLRTEHP